MKSKVRVRPEKAKVAEEGGGRKEDIRQDCCIGDKPGYHRETARRSTGCFGNWVCPAGLLQKVCVGFGD